MRGALRAARRVAVGALGWGDSAPPWALSCLAVAAVGALGVVGTVPVSASASPFDLMGAGARSVALSGGNPADVEGPAAAHANPAALALTAGGVEAAMVGTALPVSVHLSRAVCTEAPAACAATYGGVPTARHAPLLPRGGPGLQLGIAGRHPHLWPARLGGGALLHLPGAGLVHLRGPMREQPHFPRLEALPQRLSLLLSAGFALSDRLAIGAGVQVLASIGSHISGDLDPTGGRIEPAAVTIALRPVARLVAGVHWRPRGDLALGLSVRQAIGLRSAITSRLSADPVVHAAMRIDLSGLWSPLTVQFGVRWLAPSRRLRVQAALQLARWSQLRDPTPQVRIDLQGDVLRGLGAERWLDVGTQRAAATPGASDTVSPQLGVEASPWPGILHDRLRLRAGYAFHPAMLPRATGTSNLIDNDAHVFGAGAEWALRAVWVRGDDTSRRADLASPSRGPFVAFGAQGQYLPRRSAAKQGGDRDPIGDLDHGGAVWHLVLQAGHRF